MLRKRRSALYKYRYSMTSMTFTFMSVDYVNNINAMQFGSGKIKFAREVGRLLLLQRVFGLSMGNARSSEMPTEQNALPGRTTNVMDSVAGKHYVNKNTMKPPFPASTELAMFGMGCFWGVERKFWQQNGVFSTQVGYAAGYTKNPTYREVCSGDTGHNEVVRVVFDPKLLTYEDLLTVFWENHDPSQGMRQGNDSGTQYRSGIYYYDDEQQELAEETKLRFQKELAKKGRGKITTEILAAPEFYYAEDDHQQYLAKNPDGYCGMGGMGICMPKNTEEKKDEL